MNYSNLFHSEHYFSKSTFDEHKNKYKFNNLERIEIFLWDLELFLQIQNCLKDKIVLKGGAATQFYLPVEAQRTSIDIDMLLYGNEKDIENSLSLIKTRLGDEFFYKRYYPKNPKTELPLFTYNMNVPSVLKKEGKFIKLEFIIQNTKSEYSLVSGENIFLTNPEFKYQILPISDLFADKLTTLGNNTIGVPDERLDEQIKQFYDIANLLRYNFDRLNPEEVKSSYLKRAESEWIVRNKKENSKNFFLQNIIADVFNQLARYEAVDYSDDKELKKYIMDFKSLYLNSNIDFEPVQVANYSVLIKMLFQIIFKEDDLRHWNKIKRCFELEKYIEFNNLSGVEKGIIIKTVKNDLIHNFGNYSSLGEKLLKGKHIKRVFWAIITIDNIDEIENTIKKAEKKHV